MEELRIEGIQDVILKVDGGKLVLIDRKSPDVEQEVIISDIKRLVVNDCSSSVGISLKGLLSNIEEIVISNCGWVIFGDHCFNNCISLRTISVDNVREISFGNHCFENCTSIKSIYMPGRSSFGDYSFLNCSSLEEVITKKSASFGVMCFGNCTSLSKIDCEGFVGIDADAFNNTAADIRLTVPLDNSVRLFWNRGLSENHSIKLIKGTCCVSICNPNKNCWRCKELLKDSILRSYRKYVNLEPFF